MTILKLAVLLAACVATHGMPQFESNLFQKMAVEPETSRAYRLSHRPYEETFKQFQRDFDKKYQNAFEESQRFAIFLSNVKYIEEHNMKFYKGEVSFYMGINQFADLTHDEYLRVNGFRKYAVGKGQGINCSSPIPNEDPAPESIDWRKKGAVTPVKSQGHCFSCWIFSAVGAIEGQNFIQTGKLMSFSEQQIMDCHANCKEGGEMDDAFAFINQTGGLELESDYPYIAKDERCLFKKSKIHVEVVGCTDLPSGDENVLKSAVGLKGPVSVAIDASHASFNFYTGGVYVEPHCYKDKKLLDHGVLVVGYGTWKGVEYWLIKNSWNTTWGIKGYGMMARNRDNQCGIASEASYPATHKP